MSEPGKVTASHLSRAAVIYVRQSTVIPVERNTEPTARQYDLVNRARQLGWPREAVRVVDGDLGVSGSVTGQRDGFEGMVAEVALGQVGIILALEVSRLARDNAAWYRLLDLAGVCDTLVADADGLYHPGLFNDRLVLGMKGLMSEAELHVLRARLEGGIKNKAARGELRRGLPVGLVWGEGDGEIRFHPDEAVTGVIAAVFGQFAVCGSVRATWLWLRAQGLATCGTCGRKLAVFYRGPAKTVPNYYCQGSAELVDGRGARHMNVGGQGIDAAVAEAFLAALAPAAMQACLAAAAELEAGHDAALDQHRRQVEQARHHATRPKPRPRARHPDH